MSERCVVPCRVRRVCVCVATPVVVRRTPGGGVVPVLVDPKPQNGREEGQDHEREAASVLRQTWTPGQSV